jgi:hypothetical protein
VKLPLITIAEILLLLFRRLKTEFLQIDRKQTFIFKITLEMESEQSKYFEGLNLKIYCLDSGCNQERVFYEYEIREK